MSEIRTEIREFREFREVNVGVLNAMRADLADLREHVDRGFVEMRGRLDASAAGHQQIVELLGTILSRERDEGPDR